LSQRRVLLDECIDRRFARHLPDHAVSAVPEMGWSGAANGRLLKLAQEQFDAFITVDRNLSFQQNLPAFDIAVIVLHARSNRLQDLIPLVPEVLARLADLKPGVAVSVPS